MKTPLLALAIVLTSCGYDDATIEAEHYNQMVCSKVWPDYQNVKPSCEERRGIDKSKQGY